MGKIDELRRTITRQMNRLEILTGRMMCEFDPMLEDEIHAAISRENYSDLMTLIGHMDNLIGEAV